MSFPESRKFLNKLNEMIHFLIPYYVKEGKTQLIIGIGCTGGRHRSVAIASRLGQMQRDKGSSVVNQHRDIDRDGQGE